MSRQPFSDPSLAAQLVARSRRPRREAKSERIIRRLLLAWLLLPGGALLTQEFPFPGSAQIGFWLIAATALGLPLVALLTLWLVGLGLREALHRVRVLRRAAKWQRQQPPTAWWEED